MSAQDKPLSYRPSAYYFRKALSEAKTVADARAIGFQAVRELEMLKAWVREQGLIPPRQHITAQEAQDKALAVIPFSPSQLAPQGTPIPSPEPAA